MSESAYLRAVPENNNPNTAILLALEYPALRRRAVRRHIQVEHEYDVPPLKIPVEFEGVVP